MNPGSQENSILLTNLNISIAVLKIREIELRNTQNIYISENFFLDCDADGMKINATFGGSFLVKLQILEFVTTFSHLCEMFRFILAIIP